MSFISDADERSKELPEPSPLTRWRKNMIYCLQVRGSPVKAFRTKCTVDDGSDISKLMEIFTDSSKYDFEKFPKVSGRKHQFKVDEGGDAEVCTLVEEYAKEYAKEYAEEYAAETATAAVDRMITELNLNVSEACRIQGITVEKYQEYKMKNAQ